MKYIIGTRGSKLAVVQGEHVCNRLREAYPQDEFEIRIIKTKGDLVLDKPLHEIGDKGVFVKEIEEQILNHEADIGVHSMKDMPSEPSSGLMFTKPWKREDPRDVLILREKKSLEELPQGAVIGTGSKRREFQLKRLRSDLRIVGIRGNVDTRLRKMYEEKLDGIVLAAAGLHRLGMQEKITQYLETEEMIPAPAQGILALEIRREDTKLRQMLDALSDEDTARAMEAERGFLREIGADCHVPVGAVCRKNQDESLTLHVMFGNESGSRHAHIAVSGTEPEVLAKGAAAKIRSRMAGKVFLVGAGPGDPGLITVKGLQVVQKADCIIYDRLSSPELLCETKPGCEKIYVGKANSNHTMRQEEINVLLVKKSMEYQNTVRLKGGDVYVFGRGGEEGIYLREHGVPFEVIPGVTSCIAGLAYAGIPITHRGVASGFHVVTAHDKNDRLAEIDFKAMADGKETCVFLMGLSKVKEIADGLLEAGMPGGTKAAVISNATMPGQKSCVSDLEHIAEETERAQPLSPAVIVVGEVVSLREELNFYEQKPLFGKRYLIPKIGENSTRLRELLMAQGAEADEIQVGVIEQMERTFTAEELRDADWLVFTSKNGVESFFKGLEESGLDIRNLAGSKIAVIGHMTEKALRRYGLYADLVPDEFDSDALAEELKKQLTKEEKVYYLKAENADYHLSQMLGSRCRFEEIAVYENRAVEPQMQVIQSLEQYDGILFTCASSAERFFASAGDGLEKIRGIYSIGKKTTECLKTLGVKEVWQAKQATYEGMVELLNERGMMVWER